MREQALQSREPASAEPAELRPPDKAGSLRSRFFKRFINCPVAFDIVAEDGTVLRLGRGAPAFHVTACSRAGMRALTSLNERRIANAYLAGDIDITGDILHAFHLRPMLKDVDVLMSAWRLVKPLLFGQVRTNQRAIGAHYDQDAEFFFNFLDREVPLYTQGIFVHDTDTLKESALRKFEYCFEACRLKPGDHILEIGPGWGGWLNYASARGVKCTGISISQYSIDFLRREAQRSGYDWELTFCDLLKYNVERKYDAIVMMGIIEHLPQYGSVLKKFSEMIKPGGRIFVDGSSSTRKYGLSKTTLTHIFPGNHSPLVLHEFLKELSRTKLQLCELFDDRHSYYLTLQNWAMNWERNRELVVAQFGEFHYRRFRLYFWGTAAQFLSRYFGCYRMILERPSDGFAGC